MASHVCSHSTFSLFSLNICNCPNVSVKLPRAYACLLFGDLFISFCKSLLFRFLFLCYNVKISLISLNLPLFCGIFLPINTLLSFYQLFYLCYQTTEKTSVHVDKCIYIQKAQFISSEIYLFINILRSRRPL